MKKISIDSNAFIYFFENSKLAFKLKKLFQQAVDQKIQIIVPTVLLTEILYLPFKVEDQKILSLYSNLDKKPYNIRFIDLNKEIAINASRIRAQYGFKTPDSLFLATALDQNVESFITNDKRLHRFKEIKVKALSEL